MFEAINSASAVYAMDREKDESEGGLLRWDRSSCSPIVGGMRERLT